MAISHLLEDFNAGIASSDAMKLISELALEDQRLASFEQGYSAGWEDAFEAQEKDQLRITGKLAESLGDLSFVHEEATAQLLASLEPVFGAVVDLVLPEIMVKAFGQHIVEQLCDMAGDQITGPATLVVPTGAGAALSPVLARELPLPVQISEDANLEKGRAFIRLGSVEREMDSTALLASIRDAFDAFTYQLKEEDQHG